VKKKLKSLSIVFVIFCLGCQSIEDVPTSPNPLVGYKVMDNPRSFVPVGAIWINNYGPNGIGVADENIEIVEGVDRYSFNSSTNAEATLSVARMVGLSSRNAKNIDVIIEGLQMYRVRDIFSLGVTSGQNVLYEAVKAKSIKIDLSGQLGADVRALLQAKGIPYNVFVRGNNKESITIDSSNLFFAYRVVGFVYLDHSRFNVLVDGYANDIFFSANGYQMVADASSLDDCFCKKMRSSEDCFGEPIYITITEPSGTSIGGIPSTKDVIHRPYLDWNKNYLLWTRTERELDTGTVFRTRYLSLDLRRSITVYPGPECMVQFSPGASGGGIIENFYELRTLASPSGW
jgi:hypothetical protein